MSWIRTPPRVRQWDGPMPTPRSPAMRVDDGKARKTVPIPKRVYVRSKALMKAYRTIECQWCGAADGTVCGAHSNWAIHGKGRSIKADDNRCASLCHKCHTRLDQGSDLTDEGRRLFWWGAFRKTVGTLLINGSWPDGVPVPSTHWPKEWA